jgi:hypothetical protein
MPLKSSKSAIELSSVWKRRTRNSYGLMTSFSVDSLNHHWMLLTASSATTKNMIFWDLRYDSKYRMNERIANVIFRFGGLEVSSWSHPSDRIIPLRSWPFASGSRCYHAFTNCTLEGEISLWDLSTQSRTDVLWSGNQTPLTYRRELVSTALVPSAVDEDVVFTGDSEGSLRCWNLRTPGSSSYLCGPYLKNLSQSSMLPKTDLQDLKTLPSQIVYSQQKAKDSLLRIQVEDRSQVTSAVNDNRSSLHVNECHHDAITDLLSWPDFLVSSCRDGTIKLWKHNN